MLKVTELAFSCYAVSDMPGARAFYEGTLGLKPTMVVDFGGGSSWVEYDLGAATLALGCAPGWKPGPDGCTVALEVQDFDAAIAHLRDQKVKFRMEPIETPVCRMAMVFDPCGNSLCIHRRKAS